MAASGRKSTDRGAPLTADIGDLTAAIGRALRATPLDEQSLRRGVWSFVEFERGEGTSPDHVVFMLKNLVRASPIPAADHPSVTKRVVLWCVEAYFGHLGGELLTADLGLSTELPYIAVAVR